MDTGVGPGISADQLNRIELGIDTLATQFSAHNGGGLATDHPFARSDVTDNVIRLRFGNGSAAAPAISFTNGTSTGFSYNTSGFIYLSFNGTSGLRMTADGQIQIPQSTTAGYGFVNGTVKLRSNNNIFQIDSAGETKFRIGPMGFDCEITDRLSVGSSSVRFREVWATDGTINISDARTKTSVDLELGLDFVRALRKISFVRTGRTRPHAGFEAQNVRTVLTDLGVDDFAGYIDPTVAGHTPLSPEDTEPPPTGWDDLALRPTEFIAPAYVAISELATRLEALEATLAE